MKIAISYLRFSTPEQEMGDSERRQITLAKSVSQAKGWKLAECEADKGISGYRGRNHEKGALGRLLKQMQPGQVLLIEDCDRWSREPVLDALSRLRDSVRHGIEVYFMRTGTLVTQANFDDLSIIVPNFFSSLLGHEESKKKAERDEKVGKAVLNKTKAAVVRGLFDMACAGHGVLAICRKLTADKTEPITMGGNKLRPCWNPTAVRRILTDKSTLGFLTLLDPPVANYWPRVVSDKVFYGTQSRLNMVKKIRCHSGSDTNLLTSLAVCRRCGFNLVAHTSKPHTIVRLVCSGAGKGRSSCSFAGAPMPLIEKSLLSFLADGDFIREKLSGQAVWPSRLDELSGQLAEAEKQSAKLANLILGDEEPPRVLYDRLKAEEAKAKALRSALEEESARLQAERPALQSYLDFKARLPALAADKAHRAELRKAITSVVQKIILDPVKEKTAKGQRWVYEVQLRGGTQPVTVIAVSKPHEGWLYRSMRPEKLQTAA
jgi:DNA invertase Pin-like site-specific DNA recombinase